MAGHSKSKNIQHRKGRQDKIKSVKNTRYSQAIYRMVRNKGAGSIEVLHLVERAKQNDVPNDVIARALDTTQEDNYEVIYYAAIQYPSAIIICAHISNRNKFSAIRASLTKCGFLVCPLDQVKHMFQLHSVVVINKESEFDMDIIIETFAFAQDIIEHDDQIVVIADASNFAMCITAAMNLSENVATIEYMNLAYHPNELIITNDIHEVVNKLFENEEVKEIYTNTDYQPYTSE
jgi:transcriptional/translational regulatory protein YebC/TACO1